MAFAPPRSRRAPAPEEAELKPEENPILAVENLLVPSDGGEPAVKNVSFVVREGEIFGIAAVVGNGQRELVEGIMGVRPPISGRVKFMNQNITHIPIRERLLRRIAYIPEDRVREGILPSLTVAESLILGAHHSLSNKGILLDWDSIFKQVEETIERFRIKTREADGYIRESFWREYSEAYIRQGFHGES